MASTRKRPSLARLLASLRPSRGRTLPVRTGFPTSLADLVVKNQGRLRKPRKPRRPDVVVPPPSTVPLTVKVADELSPPPAPSPVRPISPVAARRLDASPRSPRSATVFRLRPVVGGAAALALLAVWSEGTVAAFTVAALSLFWIESASSRRRRRRPEEAEALPDSCGSPVREVEEAPTTSRCSDSNRGCEAASPRTADRMELFAGGSCGDDPASSKSKARRSLRKLISKKLPKKREPKDQSVPLDEQPDAAAGDTTDPALKTDPSARFSTEQTPSESSMEWSSTSSSSPSSEFPLLALAPVILAGLAVGKLPATALAVLCIVFSSVVQRL